MKLICAIILLLSSVLEAGVIYHQPPLDFKPKIEVSICFIEAENKILFLHRQDNKPEGGTWGVPGGKLDKGESALRAATREVSEETHLYLNNQGVKYLGTVYVRVPKGDFTMYVFESKLKKIPSVQLNAKEHQGYKWVTLNDSLKLPLIMGEKECIDLFYPTHMIG